MKEFERVDSITPIQRPRRSRLVARKEKAKGKAMHRNLLTFAAVALVAAIGLGVPALAKIDAQRKDKDRRKPEHARRQGAASARA